MVNWKVSKSLVVVDLNRITFILPTSSSPPSVGGQNRWQVSCRYTLDTHKNKVAHCSITYMQEAHLHLHTCTHMYTRTHTHTRTTNMCVHTHRTSVHQRQHTLSITHTMYIHRRTTDLSILHQRTEEENSLHPLLSNEGPEVVHCRLQGWLGSYEGAMSMVALQVGIIETEWLHMRVTTYNIHNKWSFKSVIAGHCLSGQPLHRSCTNGWGNFGLYSEI